VHKLLKGFLKLLLAHYVARAIRKNPTHSEIIKAAQGEAEDLIDEKL
jgi:hypothetical protein